jgi:hypothetical protein
MTGVGDARLAEEQVAGARVDQRRTAGPGILDLAECAVQPRPRPYGLSVRPVGAVEVAGSSMSVVGDVQAAR